MPRDLKISIGQHSDKGRKQSNQDFHGSMLPGEPERTLKGIAVALADGISSSTVSRDAAESAIKSFLTDYYGTPDSWSVKTSAQRVIAASNSWLHAQTRRGGHAHDKDKGWVCTFSALVLKSRTAHLFHVGDCRIYRVAGGTLEQLTEDHRVVSAEQTYLGRALGVDPHVEIDYRAIELAEGDVLVMATDGVYEHVGGREIALAIANAKDDLDEAARRIVHRAFELGSSDNLTLQIVRIDSLPDGEMVELLAETNDLPFPDMPEPGRVFDGYRIERQIHASNRSHVFLARDTESDALVTVKIPAVDLRTEPTWLRQFMMEEWVARRIDSVHVLKAPAASRKRNFLYVVTEFVEGRTLAQWMIDNPRPPLETVRGIVEQIARGVQAFHRREMLHQDLRPENVMIDAAGTVKIIDFGSVRVAGIVEAAPNAAILGTAQYTAPEYLLGETGTVRADLYSLGVIAYQMLTGRLPYGARMAQARSRSQQAKVRYDSAVDETRAIPAWVDEALRRAVHFDPARRQEALSEFLHDLRRPNERFEGGQRPALAERNPLLFWKGLSAVLAASLLLLLALHFGRFH